ncbi:MAG: hypothetical protein CL609_25150 [Anaerolineaceae bacterium]|nr:hypothetical protein [Anaerolineaceae bacterium]
MEDYFDTLTDNQKTLFLSIANFAFNLGYKVKKDKTSALGYTFTNNKIKKTILRFTSQQGKPILKLKFFASSSYSVFFQNLIRFTIEEYDYKYTGCYGCGKCDGTEGYQYQYLDGREYFRCGLELIEIFDVENVPLEEFLLLFKKQHEYYLPGNK